MTVIIMFTRKQIAKAIGIPLHVVELLFNIINIKQMEFIVFDAEKRQFSILKNAN